MTEYNQTIAILNSLQNFLDNTETPSKALDDLYIDVVRSIKAINHEMENPEND
jgi:hypothetical protein